MRFTVQKSWAWEDGGWKPGFKAVGYNGAGVDFPVESKLTKDWDEAEAWCDKANAGERPAEAGWASYSDD